MPINPPTTLPSNYFYGLRNITDGALAERLNAALGGDTAGGVFRIETLADLPDPVGGVIELPPGAYLFTQDLDLGANQLAATTSGERILLAARPGHTQITSTHADRAVYVMSGSMRIDGLNITNSVGVGITTQTATLTLVDSKVTGSGSVGPAVDMRHTSTVSIERSTLVGPVTGITVGGVATRLRCQGVDFQTTTGALDRACYVNGTATVVTATFVNCRFIGGLYGLLLETGITFTNPVHLVGCGFDGYATAAIDTGGTTAGANLTLTATNE